ncbi:MAG: 8-oxoguanine DNA glycosylase [Clostridiales bacterium]|nr:8-oxoguanine DNA glycosylase [Clostridiales bacterium]
MIINMREQKIEIEKIQTFNLKDIFECGQCFRWNKNESGIYVGIVGQNVLKIKENDYKIVIESYGQDDLEELFNNYFDMNRNYEEIKNKLRSIDGYMEESIKYGEGIRILNQDLWETIISFIISANNNIPRIKGIIEKMCKEYGTRIVWNNEEFYTFPSVEQLSKASVNDLRKLGLGFRDIRIYETTKLIKDGIIDLEILHKQKDTDALREELLKLSGVGPKVADCILLFSTLKRFDVFPIDVWVRRVMNDLYIKNKNENKVSKKQILDIANIKFGDICGLAQQYLFYWKRSIG